MKNPAPTRSQPSQAPDAVGTRGPVAKKAGEVRRAEENARTDTSPQVVPETLTAAEQATGAAAGGTMDKVLLRMLTKVRRATARLIAAHAAHGAAATMAVESAPSKPTDDDGDQPVSQHHRHYAVLVLVLFEVIVVSAEAGFFYAMAARGLSSDVGIFDPQRVAAYLFAIFVPLAGILAERFSGPMIGRYFRAPATDKKQRTSQTAAVAAGLLLTGVVMAGLYQLIEWRFDPNATLSMTTPMPGQAVALLFMAIIGLMAATRAWAVPVVSTHHTDAQAAVRKAHRQKRKASTRHHQATHSLALTLAETRTRLEQVAYTGQDIISTGRAHYHYPATTAATTTGLWHSIDLPDPADSILAAAQEVLETYGATLPVQATTTSREPAPEEGDDTPDTDNGERSDRPRQDDQTDLHVV